MEVNNQDLFSKIRDNFIALITAFADNGVSRDFPDYTQGGICHE